MCVEDKGGPETGPRKKRETKNRPPEDKEGPKQARGRERESKNRPGVQKQAREWQLVPKATPRPPVEFLKENSSSSLKASFRDIGYIGFSNTGSSNTGFFRYGLFKYRFFRYR